MTLNRETIDLQATGPPVDWIDTLERTLVGARRIRELLTTRLRELDLGEPEFSLLWILASTEPAISQREIARRLAISAAQVCGLVERLRKRELIRGERDPSDRRRQCWRLTEPGAKMFRSATEKLADWIAHCDRQIAGDEKERLDRSLTVLEEATLQTPALSIATDEDKTEMEFRSGKAA